jgi:hypothetical protein
MREETFGPVAAVTPFDNEAEVIARANDTEYGLVAYVVTENGARQLRHGPRARLRHGGHQPREDHRRAGPLRRRGSNPASAAKARATASKPSPTSNISASTQPDAKKQGERPCSTSPTNLPPGTATTSSTPPPIWACTPAANPPTRVIAGGEGVYITDTSGKTSLDAFAGLYCVNVGYGRPKIADAIAEQAKNSPTTTPMSATARKRRSRCQDDHRPRARRA